MKGAVTPDKPSTWFYDARDTSGRFGMGSGGARISPAWVQDTERHARDLMAEALAPQDDYGYDLYDDDDYDEATAEADAEETRQQTEREVEARIAANREWLAARIPQASLMVQVSAGTLPAILASGGLKTADDPDAVRHGVAARNAEEMGEHSGSVEASLAARRGLQERVFGRPESPVYGYLAETPHGAQNTNGSNPLGSIQGMIPRSYGDTALRLKRDRVAERSTFTVGDSFAMTAGGGEPYLAALPVTSPDWQAAGPMDLSGVDSLDRVGMETGASYVELQVHGQVTVDDIEAVVFDRDPPLALREGLEARGVTVEVLGTDPENVTLPEGGFDEGTFDLAELAALRPSR